MSSGQFPFSIEDITGWVVKRKDGTIIKYSLVDPQHITKPTQQVKWGLTSYSGFRDWCNHEPHPGTSQPIFEADGIGLWIADAPGARKVAEEFDVCIDGGNVLTVPGEFDLPNIYGDPKLRTALSKHVFAGGTSQTHEGPKIIKLRWADRCAPPVYPSFWPALLDELRALQLKHPKETLKVLTICQGGHGRSGTALVSLMMGLSNYTPLEALTHIRALHCARAIESKDQHVYLNLVAKELGREENALAAEHVGSFKDAFLASTNPLTEPYKERLRQGKGAGEATREGSYI